jgi:2-succinyl-5-enolpyruvyl-6-hydroxy-3-cyclohexene-1-carboxylate synthase
MPSQAQVASLASALQRAQRPLVVAGEMREGERLAPALLRLGLPVLAEPTSQLRRSETGAAVESYEALLRAGWSLQHGPDLVIRLGAISDRSGPRLARPGPCRDQRHGVRAAATARSAAAA